MREYEFFWSKEIRAFPFTKVAATCMIIDSMEYAEDQPLFVKISIHSAPPDNTNPFKMEGITRRTNGGSNGNESLKMKWKRR